MAIRPLSRRPAPRTVTPTTAIYPTPPAAQSRGTMPPGREREEGRPMLLEGRLVETGRPVRVALDGARIARVEPLDTAPDRWLSAGFVDVQVNGYAGHDANAPDVTPEEIGALVRALWRAGVTAVCPTVTTQSEARICRSLRAIADARAADPLVAHAIPCIHVEGP